MTHHKQSSCTLTQCIRYSSDYPTTTCSITTCRHNIHYDECLENLSERKNDISDYFILLGIALNPNSIKKECDSIEDFWYIDAQKGKAKHSRNED